MNCNVRVFENINTVRYTNDSENAWVGRSVAAGLRRAQYGFDITALSSVWCFPALRQCHCSGA